MAADLGYTCAGCGAEALVVPGLKGLYSSRVVVPHAVGCPVAVRVAMMRARALAGQPA